ncbi:Vitamin B12 transporter BtuB [Paraburkholderia caffeinitolerans]|uniref:Vitamin B12 transporter BtuB n=1 Tax=Paraburkholderia caffeinitolerans TaxID=1723730 RepID=A0A6J5GUI3_9BURK|nr:Vitamin B12 transporter BtuB [Paraburkholderia caffeinitolerans]
MTGAFNFREEQDDLSGYIRNVAVTAGSGSGGSGSSPTYAFGALNEYNIARTYSTALEYRVDPLTRLHLTAGVSHEIYDTSVAQDNGNQWMLGATYDLTGWLQPYPSWSRKIRFPSLDQLFDPTQGNAALAPERSTNVEGGVVWTISPGNRVRVGAFSDQVDNFIQNDKTSQRYYNGDVVSNGMQVTEHGQVTYVNRTGNGSVPYGFLASTRVIAWPAIRASTNRRCASISMPLRFAV